MPLTLDFDFSDPRHPTNLGKIYIESSSALPNLSSEIFSENGTDLKLGAPHNGFPTRGLYNPDFDIIWVKLLPPSRDINRRITFRIFAPGYLSMHMCTAPDRAANVTPPAVFPGSSSLFISRRYPKVPDECSFVGFQSGVGHHIEWAESCILDIQVYV